MNLEDFFHVLINYISVIVEPLLKGEMAANYLWEVLNSVLVEGLSLVSYVFLNKLKNHLSLANLEIFLI